MNLKYPAANSRAKPQKLQLLNGKETSVEDQTEKLVPGKLVKVSEKAFGSGPSIGARTQRMLEGMTGVSYAPISICDCLRG